MGNVAVIAPPKSSLEPDMILTMRARVKNRVQWGACGIGESHRSRQCCSQTRSPRRNLGAEDRHEHVLAIDAFDASRVSSLFAFHHHLCHAPLRFSSLPTRSPLAMDYARRTTMQPHGDPYANARSNLPVPSTVKKSTHGHGRMSLAGPAMRAPYPIPPGTNPRQSLMRSQNVNPLLQSASKPQNFGRTPMRR